MYLYKTKHAYLFQLACKYVNDPVLFRRRDNGNLVKFDLRYIVFVRQFDSTGIDAFIYNNFWIRFAINEFSLSNLDDILTHMTVHNYSADTNASVYQLECQEFIAQFETLYPKLKWATIQAEIATVIKEVLRAAAK